MYRPIVLCYHAVSSSWPSSLAVSEDLLERHVGALRRRGYVGLTLAYAERARQDGTLPRRSVVVTFDDAYASTLRARPILDAVGYPGTVFVVTRFAESQERMRWSGIDTWSNGEHAHELDPLGWDELSQLQDAGWEVGSHTVSHPRPARPGRRDAAGRARGLARRDRPSPGDVRDDRLPVRSRRRPCRRGCPRCRLPVRGHADDAPCDRRAAPATESRHVPVRRGLAGTGQALAHVRGGTALATPGPAAGPFRFRLTSL